MALDEVLRMARTVEDDWRRAWISLGAVPTQPRTLVEDTREFLRIHTPGVSETLLNMVMAYSAPGPATVADVERVLDPYFAHHLPAQWWLLLGDEPEGLREALRQAGMQSWGGATAMAASLVNPEPPFAPPPRDAEFGLVGADEAGEAAVDVIARVFYIARAPLRRWTVDNPALRLYAARWNGEVVCALTTLVGEQSVGVSNVATLSGARRRGIAGNLVRYALQDARREGCNLATLTATPEARHLYEQLGFRACGVIEQWLPNYRLMTRLTGGRHAGDMWQ